MTLYTQANDYKSANLVFVYSEQRETFRAISYPQYFQVISQTRLPLLKMKFHTISPAL